MFWLIVCLVGMAVQNVYVTIDYSKYTTTTEVLMAYEDEITLPALSVCFRKDEIREVNSFQPNHPCRKKFSATPNSECASDVHFNQTILKVMSELTLNLSKTIDYLQIGNEKNITKSKYEKYMEYFSLYYEKCMIFRNVYRDKISIANISGLFFSKKLLYKVSGSKFEKTSSNLVSGIIHNNATVLTTFFFTDPENYPRGFSIQPFYHRFRNTENWLSLSYYQYEYNLLPPPYFSMCTQYGGSEVNSTEECIDQCIKQNVRSIFGEDIAIEQCLYTSDESRKNPKLKYSAGIWFDLKKQRMIVDFYNKCKSKCPLKCKSFFFEPKLTQKRNFPKYGYYYSISHKNLSRKLIFSPKLDMLSYIIFIASVCSMWLGFVILDSLISITSMIFNHKSIKSINNNTNNVKNNITLNLN